MFGDANNPAGNVTISRNLYINANFKDDAVTNLDGGTLNINNAGNKVGEGYIVLIPGDGGTYDKYCGCNLYATDAAINFNLSAAAVAADVPMLKVGKDDEEDGGVAYLGGSTVNLIVADSVNLADCLGKSILYARNGISAENTSYKINGSDKIENIKADSLYVRKQDVALGLSEDKKSLALDWTGNAKAIAGKYSDANGTTITGTTGTDSKLVLNSTVFSDSVSLNLGSETVFTGVYAETGNATGGVVDIDSTYSGTAGSTIYGGYAAGGTATGNTINLNNNSSLSAVSLIGGNTDATGNVLNITGEGNKVKSVSNFETINLKTESALTTEDIGTSYLTAAEDMVADARYTINGKDSLVVDDGVAETGYQKLAKMTLGISEKSIVLNKTAAQSLVRW